jgi:hypothetical protein
MAVSKSQVKPVAHFPTSTRIQDASAHLREAIQTATRIGFWFELLNGLYACGYLCAAGRYSQAITVWAAHAALSRQLAVIETPAMARSRRQPLSDAREALGPIGACGFQNSATGPGLVLYAARSYSLMRPPRTGRRSIRFRDRSATG